MHCTKHVGLHVNAQKGYWFEPCCVMYTSGLGEKWRLVKDVPAKVRDFRRITNLLKLIYEIYLKWKMQNPKISTRNGFRITRILTNYAQIFPMQWYTSYTCYTNHKVYLNSCMEDLSNIYNVYTCMVVSLW